MQIGFIGLGIMGRPMALNLHKAGHTLTVPERASLTPDLRESASVVAGPADVARAAGPEQHRFHVGRVGQDQDDHIGGAAEGLTKGKLVIDMSSISPTATKDFAARINKLGCDYLDAPVSGGEVGAKAASLTIMVGGPDSAFARAEPLFQAMGKNITHIGTPNGVGQTCKVANQIIVALNLQAVSEALVFAAKAGADPAKVRTALMGGFASSRILEVHAERMLKGTFDPGFRIRLHQKDLNLALSSARELGVALPSTAIAQQMFSAVVAHGGAERDHSALVQATEELAGITLRDKK
jgi:2-hydroxy-3-oxopropionate reductase